MSAVVTEIALPARDQLVADSARNRAADELAVDRLVKRPLGGAVVGREQNQRVLFESQSPDGCGDPSHVDVHLCHHLGEGVVVILVPGVRHRLLEVVGDVVAEGHRVKREEGAVLVAFHEVDHVVDIDTRPVAIGHVSSQCAVLVDHRLVIPRSLVPSKQAIVIESHPVWLLRIFQ